MSLNKYKSVWLSYSSINDYLACPRLYYLKNVFKDPITNRKVNITSPYLALGSAIHKVIEELKEIKSDKRKIEIENNLLNNFEKEWIKYKGHRGGFKNNQEEKEFKLRGENMLKKIIDNPRELLNKIIPIKYFYAGDLIPNYYISPEDNLILCGSIDWIEYLEETDKLRIIDFKTGRNDEKDDSLQLPIYCLLIMNLQKENGKDKVYNISEVAYWYLDQDNKKAGNKHQEFQIIKIDESKIIEIEKAKDYIIKVGKEIKKFRESENYICPNEKNKGEGCPNCQGFEKVYKYILEREKSKDPNIFKTIEIGDKENEVEYVGVSDYNQDMYYLEK